MIAIMRDCVPTLLVVLCPVSVCILSGRSFLIPLISIGTHHNIVDVCPCLKWPILAPFALRWYMVTSGLSYASTPRVPAKGTVGQGQMGSHAFCSSLWSGDDATVLGVVPFFLDKVGVVIPGDIGTVTCRRGGKGEVAFVADFLPTGVHPGVEERVGG